ncbi:hypothetical protein KTR66_01280 [Roseococcus sp. SDR]|uniref:hypothetical protein n=1 Tax=Roseococcus sp. SDR TaxID=2835532 RepID=UPI001BCDBE83|nr:hypothetical protein [Roseococcus sp. SDR]MBS7788603.1 hypothetical protein [Roseococcus sp. SDR]MBV1843917.1 hypothetical protein [Roseococcus sp. SDR]
MAHITVKVTSKNQLTLPKRIMEQLDYPSHFKLNVVKGALWLFPARLVSLELQAKTAGIPLDVLRLAQRLVAEGKGAEPTPTEATTPPQPGG